MASSPTGSSEESTLLEKNGGGGSLNQPFIASYDGGMTPGGAGPAATAAAEQVLPALPALPRSDSELEAAKAAQVKLPKAPSEPLTGRALLIRSLIAVLLYLSVGVLVYTTLAGMSLVDAIYFCVVTLTTVGYGDLSAHKPATKLFACVYILVGVAMVAAFLGQLVELLLDHQENLLLRLLKKSRADAMGVHNEHEKAENGQAGKPGGSSGNGGTSDPPIRKIYVEVGMGVFSFLVLVGVGTAIFKVYGHMSLIDALYLTVVSSSTVGYGDYYPSSHGTKIFAIFFLPLSTLLLGKVITDYTEMKASERTRRKQTRILLATVTAEEYSAMDTDNDRRVSPLEFMCRTLIRQEKVTQADIVEIHNRFAVLDRDNNGFIDLNEIGKERDQDGDGFIDLNEL